MQIPQNCQLDNVLIIQGLTGLNGTLSSCVSYSVKAIQQKYVDNNALLKS